MKTTLFSGLLLLVGVTGLAQKDYTKLVNPFIGTGGHGHTYPGASSPFGMVQLSPDTRMADWDGSSGYHYSDSVIYGFSHTHLSGTGIPDYCDLLFMPFTGPIAWEKEAYRSGFLHKNEKASPGYYEVLLDKHQIKAQLTTALRSGMHQYTFQGSEASLLIDLQHRDEVLDSKIEKISDHEIQGMRRSKSWASDQQLYFYIRFERPIKEFIINDSGKELSSVSQASGKALKAALRFRNGPDKQLRIQVGLSNVSMEGARKNLEADFKDWNFESVRSAVRAAWNKELRKVDISGGSYDEQVCFYTALYHTFLVPNINQDIDGQFRGTDGNVHKAEGFTNYSVFSLWDTYRAYNPLMTLLQPKRTNDWIKTFLAQYQYGGMLPVWELAGNETYCMIGYHSVSVITDAYQKGIRGFDAKLALKAMKSYAESDRFGLPQYRSSGYISNEREHESVSKTLEYAFDDWCISQFASWQNDTVTAHQYLRRAQQYKNLYDPASKHMRGKIQATWYAPFDAREINNFYTEGNSWQYSFAVPQDLETLISLHGGKQAFAVKLNELFTTSTQTTGRDQQDVTGLIGQYAQGNEPSHHMAYLFNYAGMPWRTEELIHSICTQFYRNHPDGLIGNEDCGQMSAWYVLSAMGFYPVCPGSGNYVLGTPLFDRLTLHLENGKTLTVLGKRAKAEAYYVQGMKWNGRPFTKHYIDHKNLTAGGELIFQLSDQPHKNDIAASDLPQTRITDQLITAVPYFDVPTYKFKDRQLVSINSIDTAATYYYQINGGDLQAYLKPFTIDTSCVIKAYALNNGKESFRVQQQFYKIPSDKTIQVLSQVHSMYSAGGPDALIDGIKGNTNWKAGEWQSYYNQDFEAIIDLQHQREVHYLGIDVLQDVSPWIVYPKEVLFYGSEDGINFQLISSIKNQIPAEQKDIQTQELGTTVKTKARFIKVKALSGGPLPEWHESKGNPSHLFIDEIVIK